MNIYYKLYLMCFLSIFFASHTIAKKRSKSEINAIAAQALGKQATNRRMASKNMKIVELNHTPHTVIMGYEDAGFAVISTDDLLPEILGVSNAPYSKGANPAFNWWLQAVNKVAKAAIESGESLAPIAPNTSKYPSRVENMVPTEWGQETPYNNLCPMDDNGRTLTGCVATAMAQILYIHKYPLRGQGERTIYVPYNNPKGTSVSVNFGNATYEWGKMKNRYTHNTLTGIKDYTEDEANAIATIMLHCGVASDMQYSSLGSGAFSNNAAHGLRKYFGVTTARCLDRRHYENNDSVWMDEIFNELSSGRPVLYGAVDNKMGGHAFVLCGYQEDGKVYVNWGWNGDENGYYNVDILKTKAYQFDIAQDMIVGITAPNTVTIDDISTTAPIADEVTVLTAGTLSEKIPVEKRDRIYKLKINGPLNGADFKLIRYMVGRDGIKATRGSLTNLDLSNATIVAGGGKYIDEENTEFTYETKNDEFPERLFYNCRILNRLVFPTSMKSIGLGVLAMCTSLDDAVVTNGQEKDYEFEDGAFYSKDGKKLLMVLPSKRNHLNIREGVEVVSKDAAAGCINMSGLTIPSTLKTIHNFGFYGCYSMTEIRSYADTPPTVIGSKAMQDVGTSYCKLYVPIKTKQTYLAAPFWEGFKGVADKGAYDNIIEFGTFIKARNTIRDYGDENPKFGYKIEGDFPKGEPLLTCKASLNSKVGVYTINVAKGSVEGEILKTQNGEMIVKPAILRVSVKDATRYVGEENPVFELVYEGFKNGENKSVLTAEPIVTTTATAMSEEGIYDLVLTGGEAENYEFEFTNGKLHVLNIADGVDKVENTLQQTNSIYNIKGQKIKEDQRNTTSLPSGIYIQNGKKVIKK